MEKEVENILINAGWSESRRIDKRFVVDQLVLEGFPALENVVEAMQNLGGLVIKFLNRQNGLKDDDINFDFVHATNLESPDRVFMNYMPRVKKQLVLIGSAYRDHYVLLMADDNSIYGGYDNYLCKIGNTPMDAIENIILNKNFDEIT